MAGAALAAGAGPEPVIDIHQHTNYSGRSDQELLAHQRTMGITRTVLLPAGSKFGLAAGAGRNDTVVALARANPKEYVFFANELPDIPETKAVIEKYLKAGAIGIGEQKFHVDCDSKAMQLIADIAKAHRVPVLMHFQHETYNLAFERFHTMLKKYPTVNFIGHAQTWWGNIDKNHKQEVMYPKGRVTPGGITDRLLADYPNMYGDLSAGSGLNALLRDEDHAREFLKRHQNKLLYGSDCSDKEGAGDKCSGSQQLATVRRLAPDPKALRKMLYENAARVLKMS
ncbi:MAG TPA: amidohydrolase family protein [Bryobacteraceae bacterium]|nr:amidohydrolase family protein [Bryobacteraceae bacterium]